MSIAHTPMTTISPEPSKQQSRENERVRARLRTSGDFDLYRKKVHELRRIVAGDFSRVLNTATAHPDGPANEIRASDLYDMLIVNWDEAYSNRIQQAVKQILMQVSFAIPDVEFEDLMPKEGAVNGGWIKARLAEPPRGCGARDEMRMSFLDFLVGGCGWSNSVMRKDQPSLRHCDTLDMTWDRNAKIPTRMNWASCIYREPLWYWVSEFGEASFEEELLAAADDLSILDELHAVAYYYDLDTGPNGSFYAWKMDGDSPVGDPIHNQDNPCFYQSAGRRLPYIPYSMLYFLALPSVQQPIGVVEMLLPSQMKLWKIEEHTDAVLERGKPFYQQKVGNLDAEEKKKFLNGEIGSLVEWKTSAITRADGIQLDSNVNIERQYHEKQFVAHSGTNPYAQGSPVAGITFSSEVQEIAGLSNLATSYIGKDHAAWWTESVRKLLGIGALYDDQPIDLRIDQNVVTFGRMDPIKAYLRPFADIVVKEDSTQFKPQSQTIVEAQNKLNTALLVQSMFPNAVPKAFEQYLRATGEKNLAAWLQTAQAAPAGAGMPGMGAPAAPPAMAGAGMAPAAEAAAGVT